MQIYRAQLHELEANRVCELVICYDHQAALKANDLSKISGCKLSEIASFRIL